MDIKEVVKDVVSDVIEAEKPILKEAFETAVKVVEKDVMEAVLKD